MVKGGPVSVTVSSGAVILHRVTTEDAGEVDTVRVGPDGRFAFDLPSVPDPGGRGEVYFASIEHQGILYFGPAIHRAVQLDSTYVIAVHDTVTAPPGGVELPLQTRYVILDPSGDPWQVADLFQLRHDGEGTLVAAEGGVVWSHPLPPGATDFEIGGGDVAPDAVDFTGGSLRVSAPFPPGSRQFVVRYRLERQRLELSLPGTVHAVELLVPEPAPALEVQGLQAMQPVEMEPGVTYRRFAGVDLRAARVLVLPGTPSGSFPVEWLAVGLALVLALGALWAVQRGNRAPPATAGAFAPAAAGGSAPPTADPVEERERLLLDVALVDERLEDDSVDAEERRRLEERRGELLGRLRKLG